MNSHTVTDYRDGAHGVTRSATAAGEFLIKIDGHDVALAPGQTVLDGARKLGIDVPTLCFLEKCGPQTSCLVCLVKINGKLVPSCGTPAAPGMAVESETDEVHEARRTALELLFSEHVGDCLSPCHRLCPVGLNIPVMLRHIQAGEIEQAAALVRESVPLSAVLGRLCHHPCEQGCRRGTWDSAAAIRDLERYVSDFALGFGSGSNSAAYRAGEHRGPALPKERGNVWQRLPKLDGTSVAAADAPSPRGEGWGENDSQSSEPERAFSGSIVRRPPSKSVVIIGTGPTGLAAAWQLLRDGHACTLVDRHKLPGGSLRDVPGKELLPKILFAEVAELMSMGARFQLGAALGTDVTISGLLLGFDAVLLAPGEISKAEGEAMGLAMAPGGIKLNSATGQTLQPNVFAAGRAVKPVAHLVKAIAEGVSVARRIGQFLAGEKLAETSKPFSNVMGRLDPPELNQFLAHAEATARVSPCDACAGFNRKDAALESSRCLHCDCRASGHCDLQRYAQMYEVNASRYRSQRPGFEQIVQPGGVIFEPGKCIRCGICVKLTEMAREPLGLAFIGRGFDVKIAAPFNETIEAGLRGTPEECVRTCPTGALAFRQS